MTNRSDYALQAVKGIKKSFDNAASMKIKEYQNSRLFQFNNTPEVTEIFTSTEGMTGAKQLGDLETPPSLALEDGYSVSISENRFGGAITLPETVYRRDSNDMTLKVNSYLQRQRNQLLVTNVHLFLTEIHKMYNEAFSSASAYLAPDAVEICGTHSWKSGAQFDNGVTAALSESAIDTAMEYAGGFTDASGRPMPLNFDTIVVKKGSATARTAKKLFAFGISPVAVNDINIYEGEFTIIETPYITAANKANWFLIDSSKENPLYVGIGEYPTLREPIKEANEAIRTNCTGFWKQGVINMPFAIYGSTGAA